MIVRAANGVTLVQSSVPETDVTNELTAYPPELLTAPLSVREADFTYRVDQPSATATADCQFPCHGGSVDDRARDRPASH